MSRLYKLTDTACDSWYVLVDEAEDETDAQTKWETFRDTEGNLPDEPGVREVKEVVLEASTVVADCASPGWQTLVE